jgi:hypothetical protein
MPADSGTDAARRTAIEYTRDKKHPKVPTPGGRDNQVSASANHAELRSHPGKTPMEKQLIFSQSRFCGKRKPDDFFLLALTMASISNSYQEKS